MVGVRLNGNFGSTLFQEISTIKNSDEGIKIECPFDGFVCVINKENNDLKEYYSSFILSQKKKLFSKHNEGSFKVIFISNGFISCKGFTNKMIFDVSYGNVTTDVSITYDYSISVDQSKLEAFLNFIASNHIKNGSNGECYQVILNASINNVIKECLGKELRNNSATDVESLSNDLSNIIMDKLNNSESFIRKCGLNINSFSFNISESYLHREEKKKIEHNKMLFNK